MGFQLPDQGLRWKPADLGEDHHADTKHLPSGALPKIGRWWRWKILWGHPSTDRSESQRVLCSFLVRVRDSKKWRVSVASFFSITSLQIPSDKLTMASWESPKHSFEDACCWSTDGGMFLYTINSHPSRGFLMKFPVQQSHMPVIVINHQKLIGWSSTRRILHTSLKNRLYKDEDINGNSPTGSDDFSGRSFERCKKHLQGMQCTVYQIWGLGRITDGWNHALGTWDVLIPRHHGMHCNSWQVGLISTINNHGDPRMPVTTRIFTFCSFVTCYFLFPRGGSDHR